jgi:hypothetical protein
VSDRDESLDFSFDLFEFLAACMEVCISFAVAKI